LTKCKKNRRQPDERCHGNPEQPGAWLSRENVGVHDDDADYRDGGCGQGFHLRIFDTILVAAFLAACFKGMNLPVIADLPILYGRTGESFLAMK